MGKSNFIYPTLPLTQSRKGNYLRKEKTENTEDIDSKRKISEEGKKKTQ